MSQNEKFSFYNLKDSDLDKNVYRIFPQDYLFSMFSNRENVLVRPGKWEDPFENFILNSTAITGAGEEVTFDFHNDYYGQCWTTLKASDAMWRIYSPDKYDAKKSKLPPDGIRIRTTIRKLASSLGAPLGKLEPLNSSVGKVKYMKDNELKDFAKSIFQTSISEESIVQTLLAKRNAFSHEKEIRVIYSDINKINTNGDLFKYQIDPHDLIDQIMLDPRLSVGDADTLKSKIRKVTKFKGTIKRSLLYTLSDDIVVRI